MTSDGQKGGPRRVSARSLLLRAIGGITVCLVLPEAGIVDDGLVLTGMLDHDSLSCNAVASDVARASGRALGGLFCGGLLCGDVDAVDS